jgi:predicted esterase
MSHPKPYVIQPVSEHTQSFILLHGLGSNGQKFGDELLSTAVTSEGWNLAKIFPGAKFVFPTAKKRRSSAFSRAMINQWFDIASLDDLSYKKDTQYDGLADSAKFITSLIEQEVKSVGPNQVVLGGLSHGCAMSLSILLCLNYRLAGFLGLSGWLPFQADLMCMLQESNSTNVDEDDIFGNSDSEDDTPKDAISEALYFQREVLSINIDHTVDEKAALATPAFIGHGESDEQVKVALGIKIKDTIQALGMDVTFKVYPEHGHWYKVPEEIDDILAFLEAKSGFKL